MSQKVVDIPGIGEVTLAKRKGTRNLRLTVGADGRIRVGLPSWASYQAGIDFALGRADWIRQHSAANNKLYLTDGMRIGKSYRLRFIANKHAERSRSRITGTEILIMSSGDQNDAGIQKIAMAACERALKKDAAKLLPIRLRELALKNHKTYRSVSIKKLRSRWGSCSSRQDITLNYYLIQLPWPLIDYVILHELAHTTHMHHGPGFWEHMQQLLPDVKARRKEIKSHKPVLAPLIA